MKSLPKILCIDDDNLITKALRRVLVSLNYDVTIAETLTSGINTIKNDDFDLILTDLNLPDGDGFDIIRFAKEHCPTTEVIVISAHGTLARAIEAIKIGAYYFLEKPVDAEQLELLVSKALERRMLVAESENLRKQLRKNNEYYSIIGSSQAMQEVFETIDLVAGTDANVLIIGESGTGKELVANAIHYNSLRAKKSFIKVNCAALPKDLFESELFGHLKGAFTGAVDAKQGLIGAANGGSLLLDEIGEMPIELQPKLLRILENRSYRQVGSSKEIPADFRLICSTNRDLNQSVEKGTMRQDLFYRINTITIKIPPLKQRLEEIPLLAETFIKRFNEKYQKKIVGITPDAYELMYSYSWPGNVRELHNVLERAVLLCREEEIRPANIYLERMSEIVNSNVTSVVEQKSSIDDLVFSSKELTNFSLDEIEKKAILYVLEKTNWNKVAAAKSLGIYRARLYSLMKKHGLTDETDDSSLEQES
ncbi:MAG: sigma-54-dependent Fis family transcriptional regulator [Blastocatellia bacterium]|nr:sigma-54-dependent Fis family transcriptional regulator [Blastocatellia bacterium]MBN8725616.1 sigma-54-dependent Fis family transcriptional regulator [Acidobacteriota bacterium]